MVNLNYLILNNYIPNNTKTKKSTTNIIHFIFKQSTAKYYNQKNKNNIKVKYVYYFCMRIIDF